MKKILLLGAMCAMLFACTDTDTNVIKNPEQGEMVEVAVSFGADGLDVATRGFLDDALNTLYFEDLIQSLTIYIYNSGSSFVKTHTVTLADIKMGRTIIQMPRAATGMICTFYGVANFNASSGGSDEATMLSSSYCNTNVISLNYNEASKIIKSGYAKLPMSGCTQAEVSPYGYFSEIHIPLKRIVAKVALEWEVDPDFSLNHDGATIIINTVSLSSVPTFGYTFEGDQIRQYTVGSSSITTFIQTPASLDSKYQNLWYLYESNSSKQPPTIILSGIFDRDGDPATENDRHDVHFSIPVDYITNKGIVERNNIYRISAVIKGLGENNLAGSWEIFDWNGQPINDRELGL